MLSRLATSLRPHTYLRKPLNSLTFIALHHIFIQSFPTPNPNFLKFVPQNKQVLGSSQSSLDISDVKYAQISPLAMQLFKVPGITRVFYGPDYISIAKEQKMQWENLKPEIYRIISHNYQNKIPLLSSDSVIKDSTQILDTDSQNVQFIKEILISRIRPTVQEDGGDIKFVSFDQNTGKLVLKLAGACSSCPSSTVTLKNGIEKMLMFYVKEVKEVVAQD